MTGTRTLQVIIKHSLSHLSKAIDNPNNQLGSSLNIESGQI